MVTFHYLLVRSFTLLSCVRWPVCSSDDVNWIERVFVICLIQFLENFAKNKIKKILSKCYLNADLAQGMRRLSAGESIFPAITKDYRLTANRKLIPSVQTYPQDVNATQLPFRLSYYGQVHYVYSVPKLFAYKYKAHKVCGFHPPLLLRSSVSFIGAGYVVVRVLGQQ